MSEQMPEAGLSECSTLLGASTSTARDLVTLRRIVALCNEGKRVSFEEDWGENTLTIFVDGAHSHVGSPGGTEEQLMRELHDLLCGGRGLSWSEPPNAEINPRSCQGEN